MAQQQYGKMVIAIDYMNTYSRAPDLWDQIIKLLQAGGHTVICVTSGTRFNPKTREDIYLGNIEKLADAVIFSENKWKADAARARGYNVQIWIEDMPEYVSPMAIMEWQKKGYVEGI